jgi:hypothetical protein
MVLVARNTVAASSQMSVYVFGTHNTIQDNRLEGAAYYGIRVGGYGVLTNSNLVAGNRISRPAPASETTGIALSNAGDSWIVDNTVVGMGGPGILDSFPFGNDHSVIEGNVVKKCARNGIEISTDAVSVLHNRVSGSGEHGFRVAPFPYDVYLAGNSSKKNGMAGFRIEGNDCVLVENTAASNVGPALDATGNGTVLIGNLFGATP